MSQSLEERARQAERIKKSPEKFKVCEGCESIVSAKVVLCPSCHAYRFDGRAAAVIKQADILGSREQTSASPMDFM
jgi:rRNA maturation endonuclease Nob1